MANRMSDTTPNIYVNSNEGTTDTDSCSKLDTPSLGMGGGGSASLANRMLSLLICVAKDAVIVLFIIPACYLLGGIFFLGGEMLFVCLRRIGTFEQASVLWGVCKRIVIGCKGVVNGCTHGVKNAVNMYAYVVNRHAYVVNNGVNNREGANAQAAQAANPLRVCRNHILLSNPSLINKLRSSIDYANSPPSPHGSSIGAFIYIFRSAPKQSNTYMIQLNTEEYP